MSESLLIAQISTYGVVLAAIVATMGAILAGALTATQLSAYGVTVAAVSIIILLVAAVLLGRKLWCLLR